MSRSLPGFESPAVGFEQPFEMLEACHDRVARSLALLGRLVAHIAAQGHDAASRSAAADVLRYFDLAAPLHHEDEERHVFPPLLAAGDEALATRVRRLQDDHRRMAAHWALLRPVLARWAEADGPGAPGADERALAEGFASLYDSHLENEQGLVFPAARARLDDAARAAMSADMQARRRVPR